MELYHALESADHSFIAWYMFLFIRTDVRFVVVVVVLSRLLVLFLSLLLLLLLFWCVSFSPLWICLCWKTLFTLIIFHISIASKLQTIFQTDFILVNFFKPIFFISQLIYWVDKITCSFFFRPLAFLFFFLLLSIASIRKYHWWLHIYI